MPNAAWNLPQVRHSNLNFELDASFPAELCLVNVTSHTLYDSSEKLTLNCKLKSESYGTSFEYYDY